MYLTLGQRSITLLTLLLGARRVLGLYFHGLCHLAIALLKHSSIIFWLLQPSLLPSVLLMRQQQFPFNMNSVHVYSSQNTSY